MLNLPASRLSQSEVISPQPPKDCIVQMGASMGNGGGEIIETEFLDGKIISVKKRLRDLSYTAINVKVVAVD